jgi:hypothetical protein
MKTVSFSADDLNQFKKLYKQAIRDEKEIIIFRGDEYLTTYAKYLIEYLTTKFKTS